MGVRGGKKTMPKPSKTVYWNKRSGEIVNNKLNRIEVIYDKNTFQAVRHN